MKFKIALILSVALVLNLSPANIHSAKAVDILWEPGVGGDLGGEAPGLVPGAGIRTTGLLVNKSNPDELIMKIVMRDSFENRPFSAKGRNLGMWIYWPRNYCWSEKTCDGLLTVAVPSNPASYPSTKSDQFVYVASHDKGSNVNKKVTECKAPWWIENTYGARDTWAFAVSITCLGIPKDFGWYAYSSIDIGQKDIVWDFTSVQTITYPFHELAAGAAAKNKDSTLPAQSNKQICVVATTGKGYDEALDFEEQCSDSKSQWELSFCDSHTKSDLEVFKNKKWIKVKSVMSTVGSCDDPTLPNSFTHKGPLLGKYRIKNYGNNKFTTSYLNLKTYKKIVA
jgi:hypothetical protein